MANSKVKFNGQGKLVTAVGNKYMNMYIYIYMYMYIYIYIYIYTVDSVFSGHSRDQVIGPLNTESVV